MYYTLQFSVSLSAFFCREETLKGNRRWETLTNPYTSYISNLKTQLRVMLPNFILSSSVGIITYLLHNYVFFFTFAATETYFRDTSWI